MHSDKYSHSSKFEENVQCINERETYIKDNVKNSYITYQTEVLNQVVKTGVKPVNEFSVCETVVAFKCNICSFISDNSEKITTHIIGKHCTLNDSAVTERKSHNLESLDNLFVFICSICQRLCTNKNDLKTHMIQKHKLIRDEPTELDRINEKSADLKGVAKNIIKHQERLLRKLKCSVFWCKSGFPTADQRYKHEQLHNNTSEGVSSNFKCSECGRLFNTWLTTRDHLHRQHQIDFGMIKCPICNGFKSYRAIAVINHMETHSSERSHLCSTCGKTFKQWRQLRNHEILHRSPERLPPRATAKTCKKCNRCFTNTRCLKKHMQTMHENRKPFVCHICDHHTTRKALLEVHLRLHTGAKPFCCDRCHYKTIDSNSLRRHIMQHDGVPGYTCHLCSYCCIQSGSLKYHLMKKHNGEGGLFSCKKCNFVTINSSILQSHQIKHDDNDH